MIRPTTRRVRFSVATIWLLVAMATFYVWLAYVLASGCAVVWTYGARSQSPEASCQSPEASLNHAPQCGTQRDGGP
jgi:hypothetical protein